MTTHSLLLLLLPQCYYVIICAYSLFYEENVEEEKLSKWEGCNQSQNSAHYHHNDKGHKRETASQLGCDVHGESFPLKKTAYQHKNASRPLKNKLQISSPRCTNHVHTYHLSIINQNKVDLKFKCLLLGLIFSFRCLTFHRGGELKRNEIIPNFESKWELE